MNTTAALNFTGWLPGTSPILRPLLLGHYSRRHELRRGQRFGGIGDPLYLFTAAGSALVAVWQTSNAWDVSWRDFPSWWLSAFRRNPNDPLRASDLLRDALTLMGFRQSGIVYSAVNVRKVQSKTPGLVFLRAGFRYHCSTRALTRSRSLLVLKTRGI